MRFRPGTLVENWQLKLAALTLSVLLWVLVTAEQPASRWISVPVEVVLRNPDRVESPRPEPAVVSVRFTGPGREMWELALQRPRLLLPVRDAEEGEHVYVVGPSMVRVPVGLSIIPRDVRPARVRVNFGPGIPASGS